MYQKQSCIRASNPCCVCDISKTYVPLLCVWLWRVGTGKGIESIPASRAGSESPDFYLFSKGKLMIFNSIFRDRFSPARCGALRPEGGYT